VNPLTPNSEPFPTAYFTAFHDLAGDPQQRQKGGEGVGKTKVGKGMKLEVVADASGLPLGMATAGADVGEQDLLLPALRDVPLDLPAGTPVIADKGHDSTIVTTAAATRVPSHPLRCLPPHLRRLWYRISRHCRRRRGWR
jgi:Transposase DDE domain